MSSHGAEAPEAGDFEGGSQEEVQNGVTKNVLTASELAEGDNTKRGERSKRSPSKDHAHTFALKKALSKDRHLPRRGRGRGLPKKGGAGGKGTWGKLGSEMDVLAETTDVNDPNYDSDGQQNYKLKAVRPEMTETQFTEYLDTLFHEYFENGDTQEVVESLRELNISHLHHKIVHVLINLALDRKATVRELSSVLISDMYGVLLNQDIMAHSFRQLLTDLPDLTIDTPDAPQVIGQFLARAVADDCLPPRFVSSFQGNAESAQAGMALEKADVLLSLKHGIVRLDNVWGVGGGIRPVKVLIKKINLLLKEYLSSADVNEAVRCLQELEVPHFHHEVVYEAILLVIDHNKETTTSAMARLLKALWESTYITSDQMTQGFVRVLDGISDIILDAPHAYSTFDNFADVCYSQGFLPNRVLKELPGRGRKRYVSEGDGGLIKENGSVGTSITNNSGNVSN